MKLNPDGKTVAAMDCLVPGIGEIIGGSQREDNYDTLVQRMHELRPEGEGLSASISTCANTARPATRASASALSAASCI